MFDKYEKVNTIVKEFLEKESKEPEITISIHEQTTGRCIFTADVPVSECSVRKYIIPDMAECIFIRWGNESGNTILVPKEDVSNVYWDMVGDISNVHIILKTGIIIEMEKC